MSQSSQNQPSSLTSQFSNALIVRSTIGDDGVVEKTTAVQADNRIQIKSATGHVDATYAARVARFRFLPVHGVVVRCSSFGSRAQDDETGERSGGRATTTFSPYTPRDDSVRRIASSS